jgi:SAM-dependent methyltransferase
MYRLGENCFLDERGGSYRRIATGRKIEGSEWDLKQEKALGEYEETHNKGNYEDLTVSLFKFFKLYISYYCHQSKSPPRVLDIGCGIYRNIPPYIAELSEKITYVGLDPIITDYARDYLFINAKLEECAGLIGNDAFNVFVFCTSLDHFESIENVSSVVKSLSKKNSYILFFVGLHDTKYVAPDIGAKAYARIFSNMNAGHFALHWARTMVSLPVTYSLMMMRNRKLKRDVPLDEFHFHYFTEDRIRRIAASFGDLIDITFVPHTNALFLAVRTA